MGMVQSYQPEAAGRDDRQARRGSWGLTSTGIMATTKGLHGKKGRGKGKRALRVDADKRATMGMMRVKTWSKIER